MQVGDLVRISFAPWEQPVFGIFICYDYGVGVARCGTRENRSSRAYVFWEGDAGSIPIHQLQKLKDKKINFLFDKPTTP